MSQYKKDSLDYHVWQDLKLHLEHDRRQERLAAWRDIGPRVPVERAITRDGAGAQGHAPQDRSHVAWLATTMLHELRKINALPVDPHTRLALIHELSKGMA